MREKSECGIPDTALALRGGGGVMAQAEKGGVSGGRDGSTRGVVYLAYSQHLRKGLYNLARFFMLLRSSFQTRWDI